ncbi:hypothetical protein BH10PSE7_BH10PSE7_29030 [soil metagenome]
MSNITPRIALSAAFLFALPIIGGQIQGYSLPKTSGTHTAAQSVHFKSSSWPPLQQASLPAVATNRS